MTEPMQAQQIMLATMAGAMIVMFGAAYAFLFAWSRISRKPLVMPLAYAAYGILAAAVLVLAKSLDLSGFWTIVVWVMLLGYLLAPHGIWHLCVRTHEDQHSEETGSESASRFPAAEDHP